MNTDCIWGDLSTLIAAARRFGIDIVLVTSTAAGLMYARRYNAGGEEEEASSYAVYHNKNTLVMMFKWEHYGLLACKGYRNLPINY